MARENPLKGMSISDLLDLDPDTMQHMSRSEMRRVVQRLADAANKRLRRLEAAGYKRGRLSGEDTIAGTRKFSTKGKNVGQLHKEYGRLRDFLESPTSTLRGKRKAEKEARKAFDTFMGEFSKPRTDTFYGLSEEDDDIYLNVDDDLYDDDLYYGEYEFWDDSEKERYMWNMYTTLRAEGAFRSTGIDDSNRQQQYVAAFIESYNGMTYEEMLDSIRVDLTRRYEERATSSFHGRVSV